MRFSMHPGRPRGHAVPGPRRPGPAAGGPVEHPSGPLPVPPVPPVEARPEDTDPATVEVVASRGTARRLAGIAPGPWHVVTTAQPSHHPSVDFVVLVDPAPAVVGEVVAHQPHAEVVAHQPHAEVVVLLDRTAPPGWIVAMLDAGASICLRESPARLVVGHMLARRRRGRRPVTG